MSQPLFDLTNKTCAVIGGGSGIGEAVTLGCARHGARVVCLDINDAAAARVASAAKDAGAPAESGVLDIRDAAAVDAAFDRIHTSHGSLDVVICTPAINVRKKILDYKNDELDRVVDL